MALMAEEARAGYKVIAEMLEKITEEAGKLEVYQKKMVEHSHALSNLNASFDQAQSRLERLAVAKCGSRLLNL